jgi:hypothetical protein
VQIRVYDTRVKGFLLPVVAGLIAAAALTVSPLTALVVPLACWVIARAGRGLPDDERRALVTVLAVAFAARLAAIAILFLIGLPAHSDAAVGGLSGDDAYYFGRAIRARDLILGFAAGKYDFFVVNDSYGQTNYLRLLTWLQVIFGPTPYGMRVLNALLFISGAALLFRTVRRGFGPVPAFVGLAIILFLPSLFFWSISLLKESLFFLITAVLVATAFRSMQRWNTAAIVPLIGVTALCVWLLDDLRRGGMALALAGIALALVLRVVLASPKRIAAAAGVAVLVLIAAASSPAARERFIGGVTSAAQVQAGHVFTIGHAYKLLDEGFYMFPGSPGGLTFDQSLRFVGRAAATFLLTPLPWEMRSLGEFAFLPEHMLWYLMLILAPVGAVAGWKRSPMLVCLLIGYALPTAVTLAMTNGNVGTLLRLRALVTPQLAWMSAIGLLAVIAALAERTHVNRRNAFAIEGPPA